MTVTKAELHIGDPDWWDSSHRDDIRELVVAHDADPVFITCVSYDSAAGVSHLLLTVPQLDDAGKIRLECPAEPDEDCNHAECKVLFETNRVPLRIDLPHWWRPDGYTPGML